MIKLRIALVLIASAVVAEPAAAQTITGSYSLVELGGSNLPAVIEIEGDCREEIVAATLTLKADATWRLEHHERDVCGTKIKDDNESNNGRYLLTGTTIEFLYESGRTQIARGSDDLENLSTGNVQANILTVRIGGRDAFAVFRKQQ